MTDEPKVTNPEEEETEEPSPELLGTFLTGVDIDVDQWRSQTIEELQTWLDDIKNRKTEYGDPLVEFPDNWDAEKVLTQKQQFDIISKGLASGLTGPQQKEAQAELQSIRAQADKIRQLDKILSQLSDSDDEEPAISPEDEDLLNTDIVIPKIDTSGPNPFELTPDVAARLKEIDEKLGIDENEEKNAEQPTKTMDELNQELLELYRSEEKPPEDEPSDSQKATDSKPQQTKDHAMSDLKPLQIAPPSTISSVKIPKKSNRP